jgi:phage baseplate assembly protein W
MSAPAPDFLGRGWSFPPRADADGRVELVAAAQDIREAIRVILDTEPGERMMRPDFGCGLRGLLFEPIGSGTLALIEHHVEQALITWEPRIDLQSVTATAADRAQGRVDVEIGYRVRSTNTFYNLVFPFYLLEGRA